MHSPPAADTGGFVVELDNFSGPFDVLLALIGKRRLDITEVALAAVTDEFLAYVTTLRRAPLAELSHFLLVAATLLDLKTARLLPRGEVEDELDLELLEARDLLFARLLQYRAYKSMSVVLREAMSRAGQRTARDVPLEHAFRDILPPLDYTVTGAQLAALFAHVVSQDRTPPTVSIDHLHLPQVSVSEQRAVITALLRAQGNRVSFAALSADADSGLVVVARFLALLEMFKEGLCQLEQKEPLGELLVELSESADAAWLIGDSGDASDSAGSAGSAAQRTTSRDTVTSGASQTTDQGGAGQ